MDASIPARHRDLHHAPEQALALALARLQDSGERLTEPRRAVLEVLARHHEHLTADEVSVILATRGIHRATVYRTFEVLARRAIIAQRRQPGGAVAYHLVTTPSGHEHLHGVCRYCGEVTVLPADTFTASSRAIASASGFKLEPEQSAFVGLCTACQTII
ncbi:Fur family transcriptional regulator [Mycetocola zhujimingii]|uniref:Transcriptional repressor n=1 Tax=Mycetocola zhujimingii TaxID=2079792 RepID=A0A2U1TG65_9MICO|nr:transcriptional repressor [Mycetocola zhujimingii]AWB86326.1 transcriptional repressor [Mycetocola zhujimingii]PWC07879.1 transcriptional repressor [Mycetocola zhujimingii]